MTECYTAGYIRHFFGTSERFVTLEGHKAATKPPELPEGYREDANGDLIMPDGGVFYASDLDNNDAFWNLTREDAPALAIWLQRRSNETQL